MMMELIEWILLALNSSLIGDWSPLEIMAFLGVPVAFWINRYLDSQIVGDLRAMGAKPVKDALTRLEEELAINATREKRAVLGYVVYILAFFLILSILGGLTPQSGDTVVRARSAVYSIAFISIEVGAIYLMVRNLQVRRRQIMVMNQIVTLRTIGRRRKSDDAPVTIAQVDATPPTTANQTKEDIERG
jgi:hypothetical protein